MIPQPAAAANPTIPGTPAGTPPGVGASPMAAPGGGAGNQAAAIAQLKAVFPVMYKVMAAFAPGSKEWSAVSRALTALGPVVGKTEEDSLVPAAIQQMALAARGNPLKAAPPVGINRAPSPENLNEAA